MQEEGRNTLPVEINSRWHGQFRIQQCGGQDSVSKGWRTWWSSTRASGTVYSLPWAFIWPWACFWPQFFPGTAAWVGSTSGPGMLQVYHVPTLPTFGRTRHIMQVSRHSFPHFSKSALQQHLVLGYKLQPGWFPKGLLSYLSSIKLISLFRNSLDPLKSRPFLLN